MALTATLDKTSYTAGDTMTLTVTSDKRLTSDTIDVQAAGEDAKVTTTVQAGVVISDPAGRTWKPVSDNGTTATFTATA